MVAGQSGLGKTTFLRTLFQENVAPPSETVEGFSAEFTKKTDSITPYVFEAEANDGVRMLVEAIDTPGYDDDTSAVSRANEILRFIQITFDEVFDEEQRIHRNPKFEEHRIHALVYFIEPTGLGLKRADAEFMKALSSVINIIPVISKADGLTREELEAFKQQLTSDILKNDIPFVDFSKLNSTDQLSNFSSISAVVGATFPINGKAGREYPWGFVDIDDKNVSDFMTLKINLFETFRDDLKETTEDCLYEAYRSEKLLLKTRTEAEGA